MGLTGPAREITIVPNEEPVIPDYIEFGDDDGGDGDRELVPVGPPEDDDAD